MKKINSSPVDFSKCKALIFDWDGVFHSGYKNEKGESQFSEADSMGVNLLRLGYYLQSGTIPYTAIITGENNKTAFHLGEREHFDGIFYGFKNKAPLLDFLYNEHQINADEVLFVFDDVLDLSLAKNCGIRFLVARGASNSLQSYVVDNNLCDFITTCSSSNHAVREICEFILDEMKVFDKTISSRMNYGRAYKNYFEQRQRITTKYLIYQNGEPEPVKKPS